MSANNQTLVKEHNDKWYVFPNINAETWEAPGTPITLSIKSAKGPYDSRDEAFEAALDIDRESGPYGEGTEYGVQFSRLCKDDTPVEITD